MLRDEGEKRKESEKSQPQPWGGPSWFWLEDDVSDDKENRYRFRSSFSSVLGHLYGRCRVDFSIEGQSGEDTERKMG